MMKTFAVTPRRQLLRPVAALVGRLEVDVADYYYLRVRNKFVHALAEEVLVDAGELRRRVHECADYQRHGCKFGRH
jgi:hypothetical protein